MARLVPSVLAVLVAGGFAIAPMRGMTPRAIDGQLGGISPQRDPQQPQVPQVRRIPVGTSTISGTVTAADTGRPIRGARVSINGTTTAGLNAMTTAMSAVPPAAGIATPIGIAGSRGSGPNPNAALGAIMSTSRTAITDAQGSFSIPSLPAGQYSISVTRNSFLGYSYGQKKQGGQGSPLTIADGQKVSLNLQLMRGGIITGRVFGEDGDAVSGAQIRAWRYVNNNGVKRLQSSAYASTDDRGDYRMFGLQPGDYLVSATPNNSDQMVYDRMVQDSQLIEQAIASGAVQPPAAPGLPATVAIQMPTPQQPQSPQFDMGPPGYLPVYHRSASAPIDATMVRVTGGDEHPGTDIQIRLVQATNIQGTVTNPPGKETAVQLSLLNDDPTAASDGMQSSRTDSNGRFTFRNISPGKYTIVAQVISSPTVTLVNGSYPTEPQRPVQLDDAQKMWGRTPIEVQGEPMLNASVTLRPGRTVSGQVFFDMQRPPDLTRSKYTVTLSNAPANNMPMYAPLPSAEVGPDGRFTLTGVAPGQYTFRLPFSAKSAMVDGVDTLDFGFNFTAARDVTDALLTVTDKFTQVTGMLVDGTGRPASNYTVIAAAVDERYWTPGSRRISVSRQMPDGRYMLSNLPPGDYLLAAVSDLEPGGQYDLELLKSLTTAGAMRITITEGAKIAQDLRVAR